MVQVTVITDEAHTVEAVADDGRLLVEPPDLADGRGLDAEARRAVPGRPVCAGG